MHATVRYHKLKPPEPIKKYKSTVGKKMAAVHFTTIPCEPNIQCTKKGTKVQGTKKAKFLQYLSLY